MTASSSCLNVTSRRGLEGRANCGLPLQIAVAAVWLFLVIAYVGPARAADPFVDEARTAFRQQRFDEALAKVDAALKQAPASAEARLLRAAINESRQDYPAAIEDYTALVDLPEIKDSTHALAEAYDRRGSAHFCAALIDESIADFDRAIALEPTREPGHWRRGISYYYAGRFDDGARQFAGYQTVDDNDVENAVWRFLCQARAHGLPRAREQMLKIGRDPRVPLMTVYDLFLGRAKSPDVLKAAAEGDPPADELTNRSFYGHLYLGLWDEINDRRPESTEHLKQAVAQYDHGGYMWQVAKVHLKLRAQPK